jgi:tRNA (adenine37-N6)-methyltransferase
MMPMMTFNFEPIGTIATPFKDKYGVPRQPGLVHQASGIITLNSNPDLVTAVKTLDQFSHLWLIFVFHEHGGKNWKPSIRPPRLGGRKKVGVLASRSPHRPNPIGISAVQLDRVEFLPESVVKIYVNGVDLIDGTPILDIKPYIPYADSVPMANAGWAAEEIKKWPVHFSERAALALKKLTVTENQNTQSLITEVLQLDPRPAYQKRNQPPESIQQPMFYGIAIGNLEVKYSILSGEFKVEDVLS